MKFDKKKYDEHPYITARKHPKHDIWVYNYTHECQFEKKWDESTVLARGLVLDAYGNVVSLCMPKFFNYGETDKLKVKELPKETPNVTIKEDGSLIGISIYNDNLIIHTRGSFESDQAIWTWAYVLKNKPDLLNKLLYLGLENISLWFECIYPENRIVIDYKGYSGLKMITAINKETGIEFLYKEMVNLALLLGFEHVYEKKISHIRDLLDIVENLSGNQEGFVCRYSNGLRMKMKGNEYVRLHKLYTGLSNKSIWELMIKGLNVQAYILELPDELFEYAQKTYEELRQNYEEIENKCIELMHEIRKLEDRKEKAAYVLKNYKKYSSILFNMLDNKEYKHIIYSMIKPVYEKPMLKKDEEE